MMDRMVNLLFGCRHKQTTRPITPIHKAGDTYVTCLECGRRLHYDLSKMRMGKPLAEESKAPRAKSTGV